MARRLGRVALGIWRDAHGYRVRFKAGGREISRRFPPAASLPELTRWRREAIRVHRGHSSTRGTLAQDVPRYLRAVAAMPTIRDRARDLQAWVDRLGYRRRATLQPDELRAILAAWRTDGLAASTVNHRRCALSHLYTVLDGRTAYNPLREIPTYREPPPVRRGVPLATVAAILAAMPPSLTRIRLSVLAWTGARPRELMRAEPGDVDLEARVWWVRTAKGGPPRDLPLAPRALEAWQDYLMRGVWGAWSLASARASLHRACRRLEIPPLRIYDLRHSWASAMRLAGADLADVQSYLGHSAPSLTQRYAPTQAAKIRGVVEALAPMLGR